jgi:hypothetical protein
MMGDQNMKCAPGFVSNNEEELPVPKPFSRALPPEMVVHGLCGLWGNNALYRIFAFINAPMTRACFVCDEALDEDYSCDFWLGNGDYKGAYYVGFLCRRCWNDAPAYGDKHNEYAESLFLPVIDDLLARAQRDNKFSQEE